MVNPCFTYFHKTQCKTTRHGTDITELRLQTIRGRLAVARRRLVTCECEGDREARTQPEGGEPAGKQC